MKKELKGFERLRKALTLGAVGSAGLLGMGSGRAATTNLAVTIQVSSVVTSGTSMEISSINDNTVSHSAVLLSTATTNSSSNNASGINDATINGVTHTWSGTNYSGVFSSGSSANTSIDDAFDGYGGIFVDGAPYNDTDGVVDLTGTTLTTDPELMPNGLEVSKQYHVFTDKRVTRMIFTLHNPSAAAITSRIAIGGNLGSDSRTYVANTSNGNQTVELGDTWVMTHDNGVYGGVATRDPILTHVAGSYAIPLNIPGAGSDDISFGYDVTVKPGDTKYITWFVQFSERMTEANASLSDYADYPSADAAGLFINKPAGMINGGLNWTYAAAVPVPFLSPFNLALLFGLFGFASYRKLRTSK